MAISATHYQLLKRLNLPRGGSLLEIGEANWYGDVAPDFPCEDTANWFTVAKAAYASIFAPSRIVSIDYNGSPNALRHDLNQPLPDLGEFDVVINHGTAEHVFNIAQVFASMHAACAVDGWLIHESPFTGWIDHGFYCLQPTLFYDLARANCYEIAGVWIEEIRSQTIIDVHGRDHIAALNIPNNAMLFVALRKRIADPFRLPHQGYYARELSEAGVKAWSEKR